MLDQQNNEDYIKSISRATSNLLESKLIISNILKQLPQLNPEWKAIFDSLRPIYVQDKELENNRKFYRNNNVSKFLKYYKETALIPFIWIKNNKSLQEVIEILKPRLEKIRWMILKQKEREISKWEVQNVKWNENPDERYWTDDWFHDNSADTREISKENSIRFRWSKSYETMYWNAFEFKKHIHTYLSEFVWKDIWNWNWFERMPNENTRDSALNWSFIVDVTNKVSWRKQETYTMHVSPMVSWLVSVSLEVYDNDADKELRSIHLNKHVLFEKINDIIKYSHLSNTELNERLN